ncbi:hypothetical protein G4B88_014303 [Cannabis sativa]|uniref:Pentatricopeptide repeat-containing protein n=1 Tax=Cannabis sativa TaxID=3483 RepID=A0A7J6I8G9_CANSA|nr:hypothetical protein G4B88_014303 [Cannabis sativa]
MSEPVGTSMSEMQEMEIRPDVILYTVLINGYSKIGKFQDAAVLFREMIESGLEPDAVAYRGDVDGAVTLINEMFSKGLEPDTHAIPDLH